MRLKDCFQLSRLCLIIAVAGFQLPSTHAQTRERWQDPVPQAEDMARRLDVSPPSNEGDWLAAALRADTLATHEAPITAQYQAFLYQMVGRADLVAEMEQRGFLPLPSACSPAKTLQPALETILAKAAEHQIIFLNEAHVQARDRVLLHTLLEPLRQLGFSYLAVEDFEHDPDAYAGLAYPGPAPGYHSAREPVFADVIRHAIKLGYRLIPHEVDFTNFNEIPREKQAQARESGQAQNIIDLVLANDPNARILVHVGYQHAYEGLFTFTEASPPFEPMAMRLKALTEIDPLTIDQTGCTGTTESGIPGPIGFDADGIAVITGLQEGWVDLQVRQPVTNFYGRADWLKTLGRKAVPVPEGLRKCLEPVVVEARRADEPDDATPLDRLYLAEGENLPLMLHPGAYVVRVQSESGWGATASLTVH